MDDEIVTEVIFRAYMFIGLIRNMLQDTSSTTFPKFPRYAVQNT